ncbi:MAG TPA: sterol desaturase family protein [Allosphingosinicella sp.]|jgi:sterol desaturase/sphingolipid hydroxylase (fatty acid hydroxylase superfamily)
MIGMYYYIALGLFAAFGALDLVARARAFPDVAHWRLKGAAFTLLYFAAATAGPLLWDGAIGRYRLFDASALPLALQVAGGLLLLELGIYAWHRSMHRVPLLWRWFHQLHHSAERVDIWGAFYFSPLDMIGWALLGSLVLVGGFGIGAEAAILVGVLVTFLSMFQHANIRTPHWLGYFIVRPEGHSLHHERGVHGYNYCDLPLWDMLFGTFRNPRAWNGEAGFWNGASRRVGAMLLGKDVA